MDQIDVPVSEGTRIFLNFSLSLEDGSEVDSNFGGEPVDFVYGDGSLLPGFEYLLLGMTAGQRSLFTVLPENAFGQPNDNNVQAIARDHFDDDEEVKVDFNHPLAGRKIVFDVLIHRVTAAELH
jgi:FKBP-type peptidyl-prolyl cis-trans isomerase SlpA